MSRDLKRRQSEPPPARRGGSTLIGIFVGLVIGVALAAGVAWYTTRSATPFVDKGVVRPKTEAEPIPAAGVAQPNSETVQIPAPLPGKPGETGAAERRFQFYDILPGKADPVPDKVAPAPKPEAPSADMVPSVQATYLQAGAFSKVSDAENQKANLAFMGIESAIQQVMIQDRVLYRVRLGPYARLEDANRVRQELAKAGIEVSTVK